MLLVSLKTVYWAQVQAKQSSASERTVSLAHGELIWRDFFRFTTKKYASDCSNKKRAGEGVPALTNVSTSQSMICA